MAKKATIKASKVQVAFEAISIEGGLLSPEWLSKIAQLLADAQSQADYSVPKGLTLRDEISRYWRIAEALWGDYRVKTDGATDTMTATAEFVVSLLEQCLGFDDLQTSEKITVGERIYPIGYSAGNGLVPIVISSPRETLDDLTSRFGDEHRKRTAIGLIQEYLNASENVLWGLTCDGEILRIVRDNASLTKPAWVETDLKRMFQEQRYADFAAFWLICHRTRFGESLQQPDTCILERWKNACRTEGTRARDHLRIGVEEALEILGQGFISHTENKTLHEAFRSGALSAQAYFQEILRLIYRLIFLVTIEERSLLHPAKTPEAVKSLYRDGYGLRRLRDRSIKRSTFDKFSDLWESLKIVFRGVDQGEPRLGLPALGGLFADDQNPILMAAKIENRFLLHAVLKLCWLKEESGVSRVNWRDMGPEELGSVYESLLELVPQATEGGRKFSFARGDETKGNARKLSSSYYTPDSLVQSLLDTALEPVIEETIKANPKDPVDALLRLTIVDPACGSGHFLLGAARRLTGHVARFQMGGTPSAQDYRRVLRQVISNCIYGVDKNPMALELARTALWLEAMTPEAPLSFVDHHLICGDSLVGLLDFEVLNQGISPDAFKALAGDDKDICKVLSSENAKKLKELKRNKAEESTNTLLDLNKFNLIPILQNIENMPDATPKDIVAKEIALENYLALSSNAGITIAADMYICAFLAPKNINTKHLIPTTDDILRALRGSLPRTEVITFVKRIANENRVLHWKIKFSQIFAKGGFDVVLGNPPWEKLQTEELQFFSSIAPQIATLAGSQRKSAIEKLCLENSSIAGRWTNQKHLDAAIINFVKSAGRYSLTSVGKFNSYALFSELSLNLVSGRGRVGIIVPTGIATDDTTKHFFKEIVIKNKLVSLFDFENRLGLFPSVDSRYRFSLLTIDGSGKATTLSFMFFAHSTSDLKNADKQFSLTKDDISDLNPNTFTCATFRSKKDAALALFIQRNIPIFLNESLPQGNKYSPNVWRLINTSDDSGNFLPSELSREGMVPVVEAKTIHQYDHRYATYPKSSSFEMEALEVPAEQKKYPDFEISSRFYIKNSYFLERLPEKYHRKDWFMTIRNITRATDERTVIASVIPRMASCEVTPYVEIDGDAKVTAFLLGSLNSYALDFVARQKVGGIHLSYFILYQLPIPHPDFCKQIPSDYFVNRVLELVYTSYSLKGFAEELGYLGPPFEWSDERRMQIRAELDAAYFHLFFPSATDCLWKNSDGLSEIDDDIKLLFKDPKAAIEHVLDSFPIVKRKEEKKFGKYLSKEIILKEYENIAMRYFVK